MTTKILIVTGDAAESLEVLYPYQRLLEEGYEVHIAAPVRKKLQFVVHDFEPGFDTYTEKPGYTWQADLAFSEVDPGAYAAIVIPGGRAPEYLRNDKTVLAILREFDRAGKWIFSICHGIQLLAAAGLLKGKQITCYEHCRIEAEAAGATWLAQDAVRDGRIVSAPTWQEHPAFYREAFACLQHDLPPKDGSHERTPVTA